MRLQVDVFHLISMPSQLPPCKETLKTDAHVLCIHERSLNFFSLYSVP